MRLRPEIRLTEAIRMLEELVRGLDMDLANVHNTGSQTRYFDWIDRTERLLRSLFVDTDLVDALHSDRHWHIRRYWESRPIGFESTPDENKWIQSDSQSVYLIANELRWHLERLRTVLDHLKLFLPLTEPGALPMVLDTNVFLNFDPFREEIDQAKWWEIARAAKGAEFHLVVPVLVLDELDRLAHSGDRRLSRRARAAQRNLDPFLDHLLTGKPREIRPGAGWMTVEILPDAPSHRRQADNDTELLDRAEFLHQVTGQWVRFVTADRGMQVRGKVRGLLPAPVPVRMVRMVAMPEELRVSEDTTRSPQSGGDSR